MKMQDTLSLYDFLGNLSWFGIIAIFILFSLVVAYITLNILDKIFEPQNKKAKGIITLLLVLVIITCGIILKTEADTSKKDLAYSNSIKSYLIERKQRYRSLRGLAQDITLNSTDTLCLSEKCIVDRMNQIREVVKSHPYEFIRTTVSEDWNNNAEGLELIDEKATKIVDSAIDKMIPYYQNKIIYYMLNNHKDILSYDFILDSLDGRCYESTLDLVVVNSKGLLIPINRDLPAVVLNKSLVKFLGYLNKPN